MASCAQLLLLQRFCSATSNSVVFWDFLFNMYDHMTRVKVANQLFGKSFKLWQYANSNGDSANVWKMLSRLYERELLHSVL